jgi:hypothetical protein
VTPDGQRFLGGRTIDHHHASGRHAADGCHQLAGGIAIGQLPVNALTVGVVRQLAPSGEANRPYLIGLRPDDGAEKFMRK